MGPATNIHVLFESVRTKDGVSVAFDIIVSKRDPVSYH